MAKRDPPETARIFEAFCEVQNLSPTKLSERHRGKINTAIKDLEDCYPGIRKPKYDTNTIGHVADEVRRRWPLFVAANPNLRLYTALGLTGQWGHYELIRTALDELKAMFTPWFHERMALWSTHGLDRDQAARLWLRVVGNIERGTWTRRVQGAAVSWCEQLDYHCDLRPEFIKPGIARALAALEAEQEADHD